MDLSKAGRGGVAGAVLAQGGGQGQIQPEGEVGLQAAGGDALEVGDRLGGQAAAIPLVGGGGTAEAVAEHPFSRIQRGTDRSGNMVGAQVP